MDESRRDRSEYLILILPMMATAVLMAAQSIALIPGSIILAALGVAWISLWGRRRVLLQPRPSATHGVRPTVADLLECLPDPAILLNGNRELLASNRVAQDVLNIGPIGRDLAVSLRHPTVLAAAEAVAHGAPSFSEEVTLPSPIPRTFTLFAAGLPDTGGPEAARIALIFRDETQVKRAEQSRADFVANASHELRSPLSAIIGFIETLLGAASDDEEARTRFLVLMQGEAHRMARLIDDLMSLTRVEINEHIPPRIAVNVATVVERVANTLAVRAEKKAMVIEVDCHRPLPDVIGDPDQLTQVVHNLVDNAIKYGRSGTPIRITAHWADRLPGANTPGVAVAVRDEGDGIAAIHLPRLTERFYRADAGRSRRLGGTGLGLAIVKHIVKRHRGRLTIDSVVGHGSTFTVFLPAAEQSMRASASETTHGSDDVIKA